MASSKHKYSLRKTFPQIFCASFVVLLVTILILMHFQITSINITLDNRIAVILSQFSDEISLATDVLKNDAYNIYLNDTSFLLLSRSDDDFSDNLNAYEFYKNARSRFLLEDHAHAYCLYYGDNYSKRRYLIDNNQIPQGKMDDLKSMVQAILPQLEDPYNWRILSVDDTLYLTMIVKKKHAAVAIFYNTAELQSVIHSQFPKATLSVLTSDFSYGQFSLFSEEELRALLAGSDASFRQTVKGNQIAAFYSGTPACWYVLCIPNDLNRYITSGSVTILLLLLAIVSLFIWTLHFMRKEFSAPLQQMTTDIQAIRNGSAQNVSPTTSCFEEFRQYTETLQDTITALEEQRLKTYEEIISRQKADLQYLQLQLNPHFYINNLKLVSALASKGETDQIQELVYKLSVYLRYLLQNRRELVPLSEELQFVQNYIDLLRISSRREVTYEFEIAPAARSVMVPVLSVQTFVENSYKYAELPVSELCLDIRISADILAMEDTRLLDITISDNGTGYSDAVLAKLNHPDYREERHIGIQNILQRCRLIYEDGFEYNFRNEDGATSELLLPLFPPIRK